MTFPASPTEDGGAKIHFLSTDGNAAAGWFAVTEGATDTGGNTVGFAGIATHIEGDTLSAPGGLNTTATDVPLVLVAGDDSGSAVPFQLAGGDLKITLDSEAVVLGAGSAAIGKLAANSGVDIGNVDVTSLIPGTSGSSLGKAEDVAFGGGDTGVAVLAVRDDALGGITPAAGDYATLLVDANGALWTHDDALDAALDGAYLNVNANIAGTDFVGGEGTIAAGVQRVTIATDDEVNNLLGAIDADTSAMATSLGNLDNAVDGNYLDVNLNLAGTDATANAGNADATTLRVVVATDQAVLPISDNNNSLTVDGNLGDAGPGFTTVYKYLAKSTTADATLWDPAAGKEVVLTDVIISISGTATDVNLAFGSGTDLTTQFMKFHGDVRGGLTHTFRSPIRGGADNNLNIDLSAAQAMTITVSGYEETP